MKNLPLCLVGLLEVGVASLKPIDLGEETLVGLLPAQELADHLLDVRVASAGPHPHESLLDVSVSIHLAFHLALEVLRPDLLTEELLLLFLFVLVTRIILGFLTDGVLVDLTLVALLNRVLFVLDRQVERGDALLALLLVALKVSHQVLKSEARLQLLLASLDLL